LYFALLVCHRDKTSYHNNKQKACQLLPFFKNMFKLAYNAGYRHNLTLNYCRKNYGYNATIGKISYGKTPKNEKSNKKLE